MRGTAFAIRLLCTLLACTVCGCATGKPRPAAGNKDTAPPATIVLFGDSTTAPRGPLAIFGALLEQELPALGYPVNVINAGVGGNSTADARARFETDVLAHNPGIVTIAFGINDAAVDVWKGATAPRLPLPKYQDNLRYFVRALKSRGATPVLLTPNPLEWTPKLLEMYGKAPYEPEREDGFNVLLNDYVQAVREIAKEENVLLVDVQSLFKKHKRRTPGQSLLLDGMHPNEYGHRLIADALLRTLTPILEGATSGSS